MSKAPFVNLYKLRTVADADTKPCLICYKPTPNVLITLKSQSFEKVDFFYVCKSHLDDLNFCKKRYITDDIDDQNGNRSLELKINSLQKEQFNLKDRIAKLKRTIEDSNSQLVKLVGYFTKAKANDELKQTSENDDDNKDKDKDKDNEKDNDKIKLANLEREYQSVSKQLNDLQIKNCKYQLDQSFYHSRLKKHLDTERKIQQQLKLQDPSFFPSVSHLPKPGVGDVP